MDGGLATLLAAAVAAAASLYNVFAQRSSSLREAHRTKLDPHIDDLSRHLHSIVAASKVYLQKKGEISIDNWRKKANQSGRELAKLRPALRYSLWGLEKGLRTLNRLPHWVQHSNHDPELAGRVAESGDKLRKALDFSVRRCYASGRSPSWYERLWVERRRKQLEAVYYAGSNQETEDDLLEDEEDIETQPLLDLHNLPLQADEGQERSQPVRTKARS